MLKTEIKIEDFGVMDKLQWGNRKRLRFVKVKESTVMNGKSDGNGIVVKKKITSQRVDWRVVNEQDSHHHNHLPPLHASSPQRINRKIMAALSSPEKEDRYYTTRGSSGGGFDESSSSKKVLTMDAHKESKKTVWPKLFTTLSSKEKEEDFMAMKGCKLPQRPKKRAKIIQKTLLLVTPGAWLSDLCQERYEVREKKSSKKRPRGLKAMGSMESDSE
ncbi:hypothetical protein L1987_00619 [Smallanthus sonchifolius]|uniref:Uncharacterized protein n=1 Tax=Smallanthus sonchifolius TaxID=185202 RepID=A0ACB9K2W1_9ASTR|nr:hypothetical protein L1987_00619 [Smallanthus sonchifolius]